MFPSSALEVVLSPDLVPGLHFHCRVPIHHYRQFDGWTSVITVIGDRSLTNSFQLRFHNSKVWFFELHTVLLQQRSTVGA